MEWLLSANIFQNLTRFCTLPGKRTKLQGNVTPDHPLFFPEKNERAESPAHASQLTTKFDLNQYCPHHDSERQKGMQGFDFQKLKLRKFASQEPRQLEECRSKK